MLSTSLNLPFQGAHLLIFFIKRFVPKKYPRHSKTRSGMDLCLQYRFSDNYEIIET